jgi:hypothetical protein
MRVDKITATGAVFSLMAIAFLTLIIIQHNFPAFEYATTSNHYVNITQDIGQENSRFMWTNRNVDLIAQAFVIFAAAAASLAMLRIEEKKEHQ